MPPALRYEHVFAFQIGRGNGHADGGNGGMPVLEKFEPATWYPAKKLERRQPFFLSRAHHVGGVYGVDFGDAWRPQTKPLGILEVCVCISRSLAFGAYATTIGSENEIEKRHRN